jgi:glyoxalase superfamily protein
VKIRRHIIVFDAADIEAESLFWAGLFGGEVHRDDGWHSVTVDGEWIIGVQLAVNHVSPTWPTGAQQQQQQQVHLDLHVDDIDEAGRLAVSLGGRQLQATRAAADNPDGDERFAVFASPAGHPLCFGTH